MQVDSPKRPAARRITAIVATICGAAFVLVSAASAGECPAGKMTADGQKPGATAHKNVTDKVIASIDLANEKIARKDYKFRMRRLVVQPGGEVAWHSHAERPAIIYVVSGTIVEYASDCAVPIKHRAGEVTIESNKSHWWKNHTNKPVVLLSTDLLHEASDPHAM